MKKFCTGFAFTMALTFATAQIDTINNGKSIYIDSTQNLKMEIPFKKRMVDGTVKGFDLASKNLMLEGSSKKKPKTRNLELLRIRLIRQQNNCSILLMA